MEFKEVDAYISIAGTLYYVTVNYMPVCGTDLCRNRDAYRMNGFVSQTKMVLLRNTAKRRSTAFRGEKWEFAAEKEK